jgi:hypothetical protein
MNRFCLVDDYLEILVEVGRWKIIPMSSLYRLKSFNQSYQMFCRKIVKLEEEGLLNSILGNNKRKILSLTMKGLQFSPFGKSFDESEDSLNHDLIATKVVSTLIKHESFSTGEVCCYLDRIDLEPDGVIFGAKNEIDYTLAIEVELTQKSKSRVIDKFNKYVSSNDYSYVLYVMNKESAFKTYSKVLDSLNDKVSKKIILLLDRNLGPYRFDFEDAKCRFMRSDKSFKEIFG